MSFPKCDQELAAEYGLEARTVYSLCQRYCSEEIHWTQTAGKPKTYTEPGLALIRSKLAGLAQLKDDVHSAPEKKEGGTPAQPEPARDGARTMTPGQNQPGPARTAQPLLVLRCHPNPTFVRARTPNGNPVEVRVKNNTGLRPGMRLNCHQLPDGRWECCHSKQAVKLPQSPASTPTP